MRVFEVIILQQFSPACHRPTLRYGTAQAVRPTGNPVLANKRIAITEYHRVVQGIREPPFSLRQNKAFS